MRDICIHACFDDLNPDLYCCELDHDLEECDFCPCYCSEDNFYGLCGDYQYEMAKDLELFKNF